MKYKIGDKIEFALSNFDIFSSTVLIGEVVDVRRIFFKKYRITYKTLTKKCIWIKGKDIIRIAKEG